MSLKQWVKEEREFAARMALVDAFSKMIWDSYPWYKKLWLTICDWVAGPDDW